jgi:hypothetical protein
MSSHYFEKPKDWNVAPGDKWVSGKPIGQDEIGMPKLGDPGAHEDASSKMSFGDDGGIGAKGFRTSPKGVVPPGKPCPKGTETEGAACAPTENFNPEALRRGGKKEEEESKAPQSKSSFERDIPRAPETDRQVRQLAKEGVKARLGGR